MKRLPSSEAAGGGIEGGFNRYPGIWMEVLAWFPTGRPAPVTGATAPARGDRPRWYRDLMGGWGTGVRHSIAATWVAIALASLLCPSPAQAGKQPDLKYRALEVQPVALIGHHLDITDRVKNVGKRRASRLSNSTYWFSKDRKRSGDDQLVGGQRRIGRLRRGQSSTATTSLWLRVEEIDPGDYFLVACADAAERLPERREDNNCRASAERIIVRAAPPPPVLKATPASHAFGRVPLGSTTEPVEIVFENVGGSATAPIDAVGASYPMEVVRDSCSGLRMVPEASCSIDVTYSPQQTGPGEMDAFIGGFIPLFDWPFNRVVGSAHFVGTGVTPAELVVDHEQWYFYASAGSSTWDWEFTVTNEGQAPSGELVTALTGDGADQFSVDDDTCEGQGLAGGASCVVKLIYAPDQPGVTNAQLSVTGDPGGAAETVLTGTASDPGGLEVTPQKLDFGDVAVNSSAPSQILTVTNTSPETTGPLYVGSSSAEYREFTTDEGTDTCTGVSLQPGLSCVVEVDFKPAVLGRRYGYAGVGDGTGARSVWVWLKGRGV